VAVERSSRFDVTESGALRLFVTRPPAKSARAVFLDRDGVINRRIAGGYVTRWSEFEFLPHAVDGIVHLSAQEATIIVISNQAGVGKGMVAVSALADITRRFVGEIERRGGRIDAVYYCPHTPADECACRKPKPGLLLQAHADWNLDLSGSVMLGDTESDAAAGRAVGCEVLLASDESQLAAAWRWLAGLPPN
jgi:D-glycero-D-manno-heptose 1,7-bisphosphate phosphatase